MWMNPSRLYMPFTTSWVTVVCCVHKSPVTGGLCSHVSLCLHVWCWECRVLVCCSGFFSVQSFICVLLDPNICTYVFCMHFIIISIVFVMILINCRHTHVSEGLVTLIYSITANILCNISNVSHPLMIQMQGNTPSNESCLFCEEINF